LGDATIQAASSVAIALARADCDGGTPKIIEAAEEAVRLTELLPEQQLFAQAKCVLGSALQWCGDFEQSSHHLGKSLEMARELHMGYFIGQNLFFLGHRSLSRGEYQDAIGWYQQLSEYAEAAGDAFWLSRAPNCRGAVPLELYDLDSALDLQLEGVEAARRYSAWPEPLGHSLLKAGLVNLERADYGHAEEFFSRAWELLDRDDFVRWRWHIPLLHARGALAFATGRHDEAWRFATESLELARKTYARKHEARAQRLRGEILAASGRVNEALPLIQASVSLGEELQTRREVWMGALALGKMLSRLGKDKQAETAFKTSAETIESIAAALKTDSLIQSFFDAPPVREVFERLGRLPLTRNVPVPS
jgi:tetratricopeptide (TPR) repeat protein